jgi:hypothetical protein
MERSESPEIPYSPRYSPPSSSASSPSSTGIYKNLSIYGRPVHNLGAGGYGEVNKHIAPDGSAVAIKRFKPQRPYDGFDHTP